MKNPIRWVPYMTDPSRTPSSTSTMTTWLSSTKELVIKVKFTYTCFRHMAWVDMSGMDCDSGFGLGVRNLGTQGILVQRRPLVINEIIVSLQ